MAALQEHLPALMEGSSPEALEPLLLSMVCATGSAVSPARSPAVFREMEDLIARLTAAGAVGSAAFAAERHRLVAAASRADGNWSEVCWRLWGTGN